MFLVRVISLRCSVCFAIFIDNFLDFFKKSMYFNPINMHCYRYFEIYKNVFAA